MADVSLRRSQLMLLAGSANRPLAEEISAYLKQPLCQVWKIHDYDPGP